MTHGHELKGDNEGGRECAGWRGVKGRKWDNCNSIINKIYLIFKKEINKILKRKTPNIQNSYTGQSQMDFIKHLKKR